MALHLLDSRIYTNGKVVKIFSGHSSDSTDSSVENIQVYIFRSEELIVLAMEEKTAFGLGALK